MGIKTEATVEDLYRLVSDPDNPAVYRRGDLAEPAVPGWTMPGDELFD